MCGRYSLTKFANFLIIALRVEIVTIFVPKVVAISARYTIVRKFANFARLYIPNISTNFGILLLLKGSFREFRFFIWICLDQKLVYNANCPFD